jgi:hypothetical protein
MDKKNWATKGRRLARKASEAIFDVAKLQVEIASAKAYDLQVMTTEIALDLYRITETLAVDSFQDEIDRSEGIYFPAVLHDRRGLETKLQECSDRLREVRAALNVASYEQHVARRAAQTA